RLRAKAARSGTPAPDGIHRDEQEAFMGATLTYLGHSSFFGTTGGGKSFYIDPWLEGNPRCPADFQAPRKVDNIFVTHGHFDHIAGILPVYQKGGCPVAGPYELVNLLAAEGKFAEGHGVAMGKGGTVDAGGIKVTLTHAMHSSSFGSPGTYAGEPCGLVLTFEDGKRVYHAGDTAVFGDMALIAEIYAPDLCLLPIGSRFTMDPAEAAKACEILGAKHVVPIHHSTFPPLTGTPAQFQEAVSKRGLSTKITVLEPGGSVEV
ncbi:MAG: metal-dependent hydrolase, partial [bacterium]|nr:metal-dependent hydrolase [bacterium]